MRIYGIMEGMQRAVKEYFDSPLCVGRLALCTFLMATARGSHSIRGAKCS